MAGALAVHRRLLPRRIDLHQHRPRPHPIARGHHDARDVPLACGCTCTDCGALRTATYSLASRSGTALTSAIWTGIGGGAAGGSEPEARCCPHAAVTARRRQTAHAADVFFEDGKQARRWPRLRGSQGPVGPLVLLSPRRMKRCKGVAPLIGQVEGGHARRLAPPPQPQSSERWRRALLASLPALAFLLGCFPLADFDVWWHLRTGQLIVATHTVPRLDLFTYTNATRPWIDVYWLYQVGLALLYSAGGASALVLLKATAGAMIVGLSIVGRRPEHRAWPLALAWLPGLLMVSGRLSERPEAASLVLLSAFLSCSGAPPGHRAGSGCCRSCRCCGSTATDSSCSVRWCSWPTRRNGRSDA